MKILYYDCFCGISGDMNLAALIDLGVSKEYLIQELSKLNLNSEYEIKIEKSAKLGITGTRVDVILKDKLDNNTHISEQALDRHNHEHIHNHDENSYNHEHTHMQNSDHSHENGDEEHHHGHCHNNSYEEHDNIEDHGHEHSHEEQHKAENNHFHDHNHEENTHSHEHTHEHTHNHDENANDHMKGHEHSHNNSDEHHNEENNHNYKHEHSHEEHTHNHDHHHRNLKHIEEIINSSALSDKVKTLSLNMFMKVAEAEAKVHGKTLYEVHFHEVGAIDSIVDIVGAAICLDYLNVDKIMASPVQVGGGFVKCAHGLMPVPAPATVEILKNIPINTGIVQFETTTPTGAAILAANVEEFIQKVDFSIQKIAYGIGHKDLEIPNVLRVYLGEEEAAEKIEEQYILETNIDDMNPEIYGYVEEKLFEVGALDVFKTPIYMKKGRPGIKLSVLVDEENEKNVLDVIFEETTSIGIRKYKVEKIMLNREFSKVKTEYGEITIKKSYYKGKMVKYKPEYEECKTIAKDKNVSIDKVYKAVHKQV